MAAINDGLRVRKRAMMTCVLCGCDCTSRPVRIEAVCWQCWAENYGNDSAQNRNARDAYIAGKTFERERIARILENHVDYLIDDQAYIPAFLTRAEFESIFGKDFYNDV